MMIAPSDMVLFAHVVRAQSFTGAARTLNVTKQSVSERVARLEAALGVRLLERTTRTLRLTQAGTAYFERCDAIAAQIDEANAEVQQRQTEPSGLIRVVSPTFYGRWYLISVVERFLREHPAVRVELVLSDRRVNLVEEGFDVAIRIGALDDSTLIARRLGEAPMTIVASRRHLAQHGRPTPETLAGARCIGLSPFEVWEVGGVKARLEPVLMVNDHELACSAAVAGLGLARVPEVLARPALARGTLVKVFTQPLPPPRPIFAVYPSRAHLPPRVQRFLDALSSVDASTAAGARRGGVHGAGRRGAAEPRARGARRLRVDS